METAIPLFGAGRGRQKRALTADEKSVLANKDEVLARAEVNARLGDQIVAQERLNRLQDSSQKYVTQIGEKTRALVAGGSMSSRGAQRQNEEAQLRQGWMNAGGADSDQGYQNELEALKNIMPHRTSSAATGRPGRTQRGLTMPIQRLMPMVR